MGPLLGSTVLALPLWGQAVAPAPLVFDHVTVVDVEQGKLVPDQRVVVTGTRIQAMGTPQSVATPRGAQVVDAHGKYLIPGLWDTHVHPAEFATQIFYPLFLANGILGIRDAGSPVPLDTLHRWRQEILAGTRVGPPRQLLSGQSVAGPIPDCDRSAPDNKNSNQTCVADSADAVHYVDSLKAAGADMLKPRAVDQTIYRALAAEARRLQLPFGGHATAPNTQSDGAFDASALVFGVMGPLMDPLEASDLGARIIDHSGSFDARCLGDEANVAECRPIAAQFQHNGTWLVPTIALARHPTDPLSAHFAQQMTRFWAGTVLHGNWLHDSTSADVPVGGRTDSLGRFHVLQEAGIPVMAGTDAMASPPFCKTELPPGFGLQLELALYVVHGLTPVKALQSATLEPARMWHATDSLGTVAAGKLADLVLLDADPLADITNTTAIHAVVANGRYYDRAALDQILTQVQAQGPEPCRQTPAP